MGQVRLVIQPRPMLEAKYYHCYHDSMRLLGRFMIMVLILQIAGLSAWAANNGEHDSMHTSTPTEHMMESTDDNPSCCDFSLDRAGDCLLDCLLGCLTVVATLPLETEPGGAVFSETIRLRASSSFFSLIHPPETPPPSV